MNAPMISVIVPAYNIAAYVEKTLASISAQTYDNLEIIVVNDGSTDDTGRILDRVKQNDHRMKVIHKENGGVTSARLRGVAEASGDWIGFVDGDDYVEPQMYERLMNNALSYQADISHCGYQMVFPKGHVDYYYNSGRLEQFDQETGLKALIEGSYIEPSLDNKLFHRKLFDRLLSDDLMDTSIRINEDVLMNYYLFREAKSSVYKDVCPYHYLLRENSAATSGVSEHKLKDPLKVTRILYEETKALPSVHAAAEGRYAYQLIHYSALVNYQQTGMVKAYRKEIRRELRSALLWILRSPGCSGKVKVMAVWTAIFPQSYAWVKKVYSKLKGHDRIYSLDK